MKSKKKQHTSSEESEDTNDSARSSSSESDSEVSSASEHRHKKKRKRDSSYSETESDDQKRSKKRKHKKKKKKHGKKKRRSGSDVKPDEFILSEGEETSKKKRKHKHKHVKRARSSSASEIAEVEKSQRRLHSVVKERRDSLEEVQPTRTYYQREFRRSQSADNAREREVQRFYRGSSKERRQYQEQYDQEHERFASYHHEHFDNKHKYNQTSQYNQFNDSGGRQRNFNQFKRSREPRRDKLLPRVDRPPLPPHRERSRSRSFEERPRDRNRRPEPRDEPRDDDAYRRAPDPRRDRPRPDEPRPDKPQPRPRERKSRFADAEDNKEYNWGKTEVKKEDAKNPNEKDKPNFGLSGKLTADANTVNGVVIKYTEPDDAKQPKRRWRFYPFKGDKALPILYIHRQSAFLIGRDKKVVDIALEHPSISKQHAALQYRATPFTRADGSQGRRVRPYVIDLDSANGTFVNNKKIEPRRYVELLERDVVKFGFSQREYVLLHENSKDDAQDDDQLEPALATADHIKHEKRLKQEVVEDGE
ncbi:smad nuclear-interacting protein 1 isoform X3 [Bombyx mandarina]|uniref:Smad nuclear-interacting protein 1 isoform X3 n=1 Tax=Bombyx mandarina TaxID=7092 RepID=A0A6J2JVL2_BOMMA|nr:smad nuclear-interacting protein 1 isoform X3 [Bombyx mandarina]